MLDQNTDRMWFVIGAVIVGAAIIFIANGSLPTLFASVSESFEEGTNKGIGVVEDISNYRRSIHNYISLYDGTLAPDGNMQLRRDGDTYTMSSPGNFHGGMRISQVGMALNKRNVLKFEIKKIDGNIYSIGGHLSEVEDVEVYLDGVYISDTWTKQPGGIHVEGTNAYPNDSQVHSVEVYFTPLQRLNSTSNNSHVYIQPNRLTDYREEYTVELSNISLEIIE